MRLLNRSHLMDLMLFPKNNAELVIVPSNSEGTGFLNHCYDKKFLRGYLSDMEFNAIILICSRMAAEVYHNKHVIDRMSTSTSLIMFIGIGTVLSLVGLVLLTFSAFEG